MLCYGDDLSLGEIAEEYGVSRQAVYDNIKRTEKLLETYEKKLHLYSNYIVREEIIEEIKNEMINSDFNNQKINELLENIQEIEEE
jgi:predicted DNA-binding protein YlxM (UPF0122 family)